jgi:hypothetical protein
MSATKKPWFGPKRIGFGIRPQTWQGFAVILIPTAVIIVLVALLRY